MKKAYFVAAALCAFLLSGCVTNSVRSFSNSTWDIKVGVSGCRVYAVDVTNKGSRMESFMADLYIKNKNNPNRTFGHIDIGGCFKIAPGETRSCKVYTWDADSATFSNLGGLGCPDIAFDFR